MNKQIAAILMIFIIIFGCSKDDSSSSKVSALTGKWYNASIDTKIITGTNCNLKDTTKTYIKDKDGMIYEFFSNGKMTYTAYNGGTPFTSSPTDYKFENNVITLSMQSGVIATLTISNLSSNGWRYEQTNYVWCPTKTAFTEYINFVKY